jgi:N6-adenosine-specific RNA methylase IME4
MRASTIDNSMKPWPFPELMPLRYRAIIADPAWQFKLRSKKGEAKSPQAHYRCMPFDEMAALPVSHLAADDCALFMWAWAPMIPEALALMTAWGFKFKTMGTWAKQSSTGRKWHFGPGYILRGAAEYYMVGTIGKPQRKSKSVRNLIIAPVREHSRKPDNLHADVEALYDGPYAELFGRSRRQGWDAWGNQLDKFEPG